MQRFVEWNSKIVGRIQIISGAVMISFAAVFAKLVNVGPTVSAFYRMLFGGAILLVIVAIRERSFRVPPAALGLMLLSGFFFAVDLVSWHRSIIYVGPGLATILANFQVFFLAAYGVMLFKEKVTLRYLLSIPLAFCGLFLIVGVDWSNLSSDYKLGVFFGLLTALAYSLYLLVLRRLRSLKKTVTPFASIAGISVATTFFIGIEVFLEKESFTIPDTENWIILIAYGVVAQVLGWVLISRGITKVTTSHVGLVLLLQPTLSFIWDILFFGRPTNVLDVVGASLAISAIYIGSTRERRQG